MDWYRCTNRIKSRVKGKTVHILCRDECNFVNYLPTSREASCFAG